MELDAEYEKLRIELQEARVNGDSLGEAFLHTIEYSKRDTRKPC